MSFGNKNLYNGDIFEGDLTVEGELTAKKPATFEDTVTVNAALSTESLTIDNLTLDGNTVSSTSGDIILNPTGTLVVGSGKTIATADGTWNINAAGVGQGFTQFKTDNVLIDGDTVSNSTNDLILSGSSNVRFSSDGDLAQNSLKLKSDAFHYIRWAGSTNSFGGIAPDGPAVVGFAGGTLGIDSGTQTASLTWNGNGVIVGSGLPPSGRKFTVDGACFLDDVIIENNSIRSSSSDMTVTSASGTVLIGASKNFATASGTWSILPSGAADFGSLNVDQVDIDGATVSNSLNNLTLSGSPYVRFGSDVELADKTLRLRTDGNHYLRWAGTGQLFDSLNLDGAALAGNAGGALGITSGGEAAKLVWNGNGVIIGDSMPVSGRVFTVDGASHMRNIIVGSDTQTITTSTGDLNLSSTNWRVNVEDTASGNEVALRVHNKSEDANSDAVLWIECGDTNAATAGDAYVRYDINTLGGWASGIDNSDSDKFRLAYTNGATPTLGGTKIVDWTTSGDMTNDTWTLSASGALSGITNLTASGIITNGSITLFGSTISTASGNLTLDPNSNLVITGDNCDLDASGNLEIKQSLMVNSASSGPVAANVSPIHISSNFNDNGGTRANSGITWEANGRELAVVWAQRLGGDHGDLYISLTNAGNFYDLFHFQKDGELRISNTGGTTCRYVPNGVIPSTSNYRFNSSDSGTTNWLDVNTSNSAQVTLNSGGGKVRVDDTLETNGKKVFTADSQTLTANGQTIQTDKSLIWVDDTGVYSGTILEAGTIDGQTIRVVDISTSNNISWDGTDATSNVSNGSTQTITAGEGKEFVWNNTTGRWYALN